uniref:Uncharacterized protein n=1 Tax=Arundo donax TaxID=35708 RepID=A0A0A9DH41_ARUDO
MLCCISSWLQSVYRLYIMIRSYSYHFSCPQGPSVYLGRTLMLRHII